MMSWVDVGVGIEEQEWMWFTCHSAVDEMQLLITILLPTALSVTQDKYLFYNAQY